jgi:alkaline phosphatase D
VSEVGTFRTLVDRFDDVPVRFAFTGDSDSYTSNGFLVLDQIQQEEVDFWMYIGDTIYADSLAQALQGVPKATTLEQYRGRYINNRAVPALRDLYKSIPAFILWDDHEIQNDFDLDVDSSLLNPGVQAFHEYQPISPVALEDPTCSTNPRFRTQRVGANVELFFLDERACKSDQAIASCILTMYNGSPFPYYFPTLPSFVVSQLRAAATSSGIPAALLDLLVPATVSQSCLDAIRDPSRSMLGSVQKQAFKDALLSSTAPVKVIVSQVPIMISYLNPYDRWEGYEAERIELIHFIRDQVAGKILFATTDSHATYINTVVSDPFSADLSERTPIGYEFVTGPIATMTFKQEISILVQSLGLTAFENQLQSIATQVYSIGGCTCLNFDQVSYATVDIGTDLSINVVSKDQNGSPVLNSNMNNPTDNHQCKLTF